MSSLPLFSIVPAQKRHLYSVTVMTQRFFPYTGFNYAEILRRMANPLIKYFVAVAGGHTIGFVDFELKPERSSAQILGLGVLEEWRQKGVGKALLEYALNEIRSHTDADGKPIRQVELLVSEANPAALTLYRHLGFRQHGLLDRMLGGQTILVFVKEF